jgi:hypothetical protein
VAHCADAVDVLKDQDSCSLFEPYDRFLAMECIHDMNDPMSALRTMHLLSGGDGCGYGYGTVIAMDERVVRGLLSSTSK